MPVISSGSEVPSSPPLVPPSPPAPAVVVEPPASTPPESAPALAVEPPVWTPPESVPPFAVEPLAWTPPESVPPFAAGLRVPPEPAASWSSTSASPDLQPEICATPAPNIHERTSEARMSRLLQRPCFIRLRELVLTSSSGIGSAHA
jgi:hypothetical protein